MIVHLDAPIHIYVDSLTSPAEAIADILAVLVRAGMVTLSGNIGERMMDRIAEEDKCVREAAERVAGKGMRDDKAD